MFLVCWSGCPNRNGILASPVCRRKRTMSAQRRGIAVLREFVFSVKKQKNYHP